MLLNVNTAAIWDLLYFINKDILNLNKNQIYSPLNVRATICFSENIRQSDSAKNQGCVKVEKQAEIFWFQWDSWAAATLWSVSESTIFYVWEKFLCFGFPLDI